LAIWLTLFPTADSSRARPSSSDHSACCSGRLSPAGVSVESTISLDTLTPRPAARVWIWANCSSVTRAFTKIFRPPGTRR
jgi:hypothetical protein